MCFHLSAHLSIQNIQSEIKAASYIRFLSNCSDASWPAAKTTTLSALVDLLHPLRTKSPSESPL